MNCLFGMYLLFVFVYVCVCEAGQSCCGRGAALRRDGICELLDLEETRAFVLPYVMCFIFLLDSFGG